MGANEKLVLPMARTAPASPDAGTVSAPSAQDTMEALVRQTKAAKVAIDQDLALLEKKEGCGNYCTDADFANAADDLTSQEKLSLIMMTGGYDSTMQSLRNAAKNVAGSWWEHEKLNIVQHTIDTFEKARLQLLLEATLQACLPPVCGDKKIETQKGEQCDDGNTANGDGCSSKCQAEVARARRLPRLPAPAPQLPPPVEVPDTGFDMEVPAEPPAPRGLEQLQKTFEE